MVAVLDDKGSIDSSIVLTSLLRPLLFFGRVSIHLWRLFAAAEHSALCCRSPDVAKHARSDVSSGVQGTTICSVMLRRKCLNVG
jgi:hypothetical protein